MTPDPLIKWDVVEEHLDEAAFLWGHWERALVDPEYTLREVAEGPEERLLAHLDGLVVNGRRAAEKLLLPALEETDPGLVFAAAFALLASEDGNFDDAVLEALASADEEPRGALVRALEVVPRPDLGPRLAALLARGSPAEQAAALLALSGRGIDPGVPLDPFLGAGESGLRRAALRAARVFPARALPHLVERLLVAQDPPERTLALEAGLVLRLDAAWGAVERDVRARGPEFAAAALLWGLSGERDLSPLLAALEDDARSEAALFALGFSGRPAAVDAAVPLLAEGKIAKLAGEVVSSVTDLVVERGYARPPERWDPDAPEEETEEAEEYGPEDDLPDPEPLAVEGWWNGARERYDLADRFLGGKPWTSGAVLGALETGPMRRRPALALDLAIRSRGVVQFDARALARRQLRDLASIRAAQVRISEAPYREVVKLGAPAARPPNPAP